MSSIPTGTTTPTTAHSPPPDTRNPSLVDGENVSPNIGVEMMEDVQPVVRYCICDQPPADDAFMIACEGGCEQQWYHGMWCVQLPGLCIETISSS
jgi:hypothetical protein